MRDGEQSPSLAEQFRRFAAGGRDDRAKRYERICTGIADDGALLAIAGLAPPDQRRPNIVLAAVHYLLLSGVDDPLAAYYPTVAAWRGGDPGACIGPDDGDPFGAFSEFCARHREAVVQLVRTRATQTNEIGRCAALLPALSMLGSRVSVPLAVVDLGAAAGLNLLFDRYAYDYGDGLLAGDPRSAVVLPCEVRAGVAPTALPAIASRVGLDRRPVDVCDDDEALWLLACQWPDHLDRFTRARAAITLARTEPNMPPVVEGDLVDDLARVIDPLPHDAHLCLVHTWVAAYLAPAGQRALVRAVAAIASVRPVSWLFAEAPYEVPELPVPPPPGDKVRGATAVVLVEQAPGAGPVAGRVADMHSHGRWLHWYG